MKIRYDMELPRSQKDTQTLQVLTYVLSNATSLKFKGLSMKVSSGGLFFSYCS